MLKKLIHLLSSVPATLAGGGFLILSFVFPKLNVSLPLDPAWITVFISGLPLLYSAIRKLICNPGIRKISSALLISIAMGAAIAIGDFAFVGAPNELYDTTGIYLKASSPFEMTFVCGYTNGTGNGYMPTIRAFAHGGYGCDTCRFPSGTAEILTDELLAMLVQLFKQKDA